MHHHFAEQWQRRTQPIPDPYREIFAGRILESRHIVEIVMIELIIERRERPLDFGKINHPAKVWIDRPGNMQFNPERMSMHTAALVPGRYVRQAMRRFEGEGFEEFHG